MKLGKGSVVVIGLVVVLVGLVAVGFALRRTAPEPASLPSIPRATAVQPMDVTLAEGRIYTIDPAHSEVRFHINEVLMGAETEVVGTSQQVTGQIGLAVDKPQAAQVGEIVVDAGTLLTDNNFRNRALGLQILQTARFQFVRFTPTRLEGLPERVVMEEAYPLQIVGMLEIVGQKREVVFAAEVTLLSEAELAGTARATIDYASFGIVIPAATLVEAVADEMTLVIDFTAVAAQ